MSDRKPDMSEMTASEVAMRKFLKQLGVTTHQQLEQLLQARVLVDHVDGVPDDVEVGPLADITGVVDHVNGVADGEH